MLSLCQSDRSETTGLPDEKGNEIFRSNQVNQEEWFLPFFIPFPNLLHKWNLLKRSRAMNRFVKMERQISVGPVRSGSLLEVCLFVCLVQVICRLDSQKASSRCLHYFPAAILVYHGGWYISLTPSPWTTWMDHPWITLNGPPWNLW